MSLPSRKKLAWVVWIRPENATGSRWIVRRVRVLVRHDSAKLAYVVFRNGFKAPIPYSRLATSRGKFRERMVELNALRNSDFSSTAIRNCVERNLRSRSLSTF